LIKALHACGVNGACATDARLSTVRALPHDLGVASEDDLMTSLFDAYTFRDGTPDALTARNRLWIAPMCQYSVEARDGVPTDWHLAHLGAFAVGGAGLVMTEATAVSPEGRISPQDTGIWDDAQRTAWTRVVDLVRAQGAVAGIQLAHAGRKGSTYSPWGTDRRGSVPGEDGGWEAVAPSAVAFEGYAVPAALDAEGIEKVVADFAAAARRAVEAGFQVLEVHAAHGYLLHQFLSAVSNERTDDHGGSLENRARLLLRVIAAVREAAPGTPLLLRVSATDWAPAELADRGWDIEQTITVVRWAAEAGVDLVDVSTGGNLAATRIPVAPGYQVPFAARIRRETGVAVSAVGLVTGAELAQAVVASGSADAVMVARQALRDPHVALTMARDLGVRLPYVPPQYERAYQ
jgi:2,4-dienoyl-CoA reductase-like NADH-dependent reductase (Old Yellow Enzyme family)